MMVISQHHLHLLHCRHLKHLSGVPVAPFPLCDRQVRHGLQSVGMLITQHLLPLLHYHHLRPLSGPAPRTYKQDYLWLLGYEDVPLRATSRFLFSVTTNSTASASLLPCLRPCEPFQVLTQLSYNARISCSMLHSKAGSLPSNTGATDY